MQKKLLALALAFGLTLSLAACGGNNDASGSGGNTGGDGEKITINIGHGGAESTAQQVGCLAMEEYLEGTGRFTVGGQEFLLHEGQTLIMPKDIPHAVYGQERFKMLLTVSF